MDQWRMPWETRHARSHSSRRSPAPPRRWPTASDIDVRPVEEYAAAHIPGALSLPLGELEARLAQLPADTEIVAYCRGANCVLAHDATRLLNARGHRAARLADGMLEWRIAELP